MTDPRANLATILRDMAAEVEISRAVSDISVGVDYGREERRDGWVTVQIVYSFREAR